MEEVKEQLRKISERLDGIEERLSSLENRIPYTATYQPQLFQGQIDSVTVIPGVAIYDPDDLSAAGRSMV